MSTRLCIGYDDNGKAFACPNVAGTPWGPYWCHDCDVRRLAGISASLGKMSKSFEGRRAT